LWQWAVWSKQWNTTDGWEKQGRGTRLRVQRDEAVFDGQADEAGGLVYVELGHEVGAVLLDGLLAEVEVTGDGRVRVALGDELEHFPLAGGELIERPEVRDAQGGVHEWGEDRPGDLRAEEGVTRLTARTARRSSSETARLRR